MNLIIIIVCFSFADIIIKIVGYAKCGWTSVERTTSGIDPTSLQFQFAGDEEYISDSMYLLGTLAGKCKLKMQMIVFLMVFIER